MKHLMYDNLEVLVAGSDAELGEAAAEDLASVVKAELATKNEIAIIMALGAAQSAFYAALRARDDIEWSNITVLHVDTYMGIGEAQPESGASRMRKHLLDHVKPKAFFPMRGDHVPVEEELARYTQLYNELEPILCVVGIGESGHLAFNDPPATSTRRTSSVSFSSTRPRETKLRRLGSSPPTLTSRVTDFP